MEQCNQIGRQGFTAGMKLEVTTEQAEQFASPNLNLFNVFLTRKDEETGRESAQTGNLYPLTFGDAAKWVKGIMTGMGQGIWGFRNVVDCWMEPTSVCAVEFKTEEERQRWLVEYVCQQIKRRQDREAQALRLENERLQEEIALYFQGQIGGVL